MTTFELTQAAEEDLIKIWLYSFENWGIEQADKYQTQIERCCDAVGKGTARSKPVDGLSVPIFVHRCEQHYIFFLSSERPIVLALLHGSMDFLERLKERL